MPGTVIFKKISGINELGHPVVGLLSGSEEVNMNSIVKAIRKRRSRYALKKEITLSREALKKLIEDIIVTMPSQSNSQTARLVILFGEAHDRFWDKTLEAIKNGMSKPENFPKSEKKVKTGFKAGYATILFFEDQTILKALEEKRPKYAFNVQPWSLQSAGMLQFAIWSALADEGIGASLQHYQELIEDWTKAEWDIPADWKLLAQMPLGIAYDELPEKYIMPVEERVFYHGETE